MSGTRTEKTRMAAHASDRDIAKSGTCQTVYWVKAKQEKPSYQDMSSTVAKSRYDICASYQGSWSNNLKDGYGVQLWPNGNKYDGEWRRGVREGHGTLWVYEKPADSVANSKKPISSLSCQKKAYTGDWQDDMRHGQGVANFKDGSRYEGEWAHGKRHGRGTLFLANGDSYIGEWLNDEQCGFGTGIKANGDCYEGEWVRGKREGQGLYYYRSAEKVYDGEWVADQPRTGVMLGAAEFFQNDQEVDFDHVSGATSSSGVAARTVETTTNTYIPKKLQLSLDAPAITFADRRRIFRLRYRQVPRNALVEPEQVLGEEIAAVREERQAARNLPQLDLYELFGQAALASIKQLFDRYDKNAKEPSKLRKQPTTPKEGYMNVADVAPFLAELGYIVSDYDVHVFTRDAGVRDDDTKPARLLFHDILKVIHLCDSLLSLRVKRSEKEIDNASTVDFQFFFQK